MEIQIRTKEVKPALRKALSVLLAVLMLMSSVLVAFTSLATGEASSISEGTSTTRPLITTTQWDPIPETTEKPTTAHSTTLPDPMDSTEPSETLPDIDPDVTEATEPVTGGTQGDENGNYFEYYVTEDSTVTITGYYGDEDSNITIPSVIAGYPVTEIGASAFSQAYRLENVVIPEGVKKIDNYAFCGASFLEDVQLPDSLEEIGDCAFGGTHLFNITIPAGVRKIGRNPFEYAGSLTSITVDENNTMFSSDEYGVLFDKNKELLISYPKGRDAETYTIPDGVITVGANAFYEVNRLSKLYFPDSLLHLEDNALSGCWGLENFTLPKNIVSVGESVINIYLDELKIPASLTEMGYKAFRNVNCKRITVDQDNTAFSSDENGVLYNKDKTTLIMCPQSAEITSYNIPDSVTAMENAAFYYCINLEKVYIPGSIAVIPNQCFDLCFNLQEIELSEGIQKISQSAFGDTNIKSIRLPESVTEISENAFRDCKKLTRVVLGSKVEKILDWAFYGCTKLADVHYNGTNDDFDKIDIRYNDELLSANIRYCESTATKTIDAKEPSCTEEGNTEGVGCAVCGMAFTGVEIIPITHTDEIPVDGFCDLCDESANDIDLGTNTVNVPQGEFHYLRFAPAKSGFYRAETVGEIGCDSVCNSKKRVIREGSWDGEKYVVEAYLNAGEVYYWIVSNYSYFTSCELTLSYYEEDPGYDGDCNICNGFLYTVDESGNAEIRGFYGDYFDLQLVIPSEVDGYPVTSIGRFGWSDCLVSITVPEGVTTIRDHAFDYSYNLEKVYLPDSLETIGYGAFANCENLMEITIGSGLRSVEDYAFDYCDRLKKVYYNGHQPSWDSIDFGYDNNCFYSAEFVFCNSTDTKNVDGSAATCLTDGYTDGVFCNTCNTWVSGHELIPAGHTDKDNNGICEVCEKFANDIEVGQTKNITSVDGSIVYLSFIPEESDWYSFYSLTNEYDTNGYIYDTDKNLISENDDYYSMDFVVEKYLRAGEKYYFGARSRSGDGKHSFNVKLVKGNYNGEDHGYGNSGDDDTAVGDYIYHSDYEAIVCENKTCVITYIGDGNPDIIIPSTLRGYTVIGVDSNALLDWRSSVRVIEFPSSITSIPVSDLIEGRYFGLRKIIVADGNPYYKTIDGVLYNADATMLLFCPNGYKGTLTIPASVQSFYPDALTHANGITDFEIENGNTVFSYEKGILYSTDKKRLIKALDVKGDFTVPDSVETIDASAFAGMNRLESVKISDKVTSLAYGTFFGCEALSDVELPDNLEKIGASAFERCFSLKSIDLGDTLKELGNSAFYNTGLESVALPDSLETCGNSVFASCEDIESVDLGKGFSVIGRSMFYNATSLKEITFPANITVIGGTAFAHTGIESLVIPDTVEIVGDYSFGSCNSLKNVVVGAGATTIKRAFLNCEALVSVKVGANVRYMEGAFINCISLENVEFAEGFDGYMYRAFEGCVKLKDVDLPSTVTEITYYAFEGCESLESIELPDNLEAIGNRAFLDCESLDNIDLPDDILSVGDGAFDNTAWYNRQPDGDVYLNHLLYEYKGDMPKNYTLETKEGTTLIASSAYAYRNRLKSAVLNDGLKYINVYAFVGSGITSIVIPSSVVSIDDCAFDECYKLTDVYFRGTEEQWKAINIGDFNQPLLDANIHFGVCAEHKNTENIPGTDATCSADGYTDGVFCNDCKCWLSGHELIKSGHKDENKDKYCDRCTEKLADILPGETVTVNVDAGEIEYLMFSPEAHGRYIFYSDSKQNTYGYLLDGDRNIIKRDDNSGTGRNFRIAYNLTPGNLYYFGAGYSSATESGSFDVKLDADIYGTVNGFTYRVTDGNATITGYSGLSRNVDIPSEIDGFTVTRIASNAFRWQDEIKSVTVPDSVVSIGGSAFFGCTSLRNIELGKGVNTLGNYSFANCYSLESLDIPENLAEIGKNSFVSCSNLKNFSVDKNNPYFASDKNSVLYSGDMSTIIYYPSANKNKTYTVPASVRKINPDAFIGAYNLEMVDAEDRNQSFISDNGVLFTADFKKIVLYPSGKTDEIYTVPGSVECVYSAVFGVNSNLKTLKLSEGVRCIDVTEDESNEREFGYNLTEIYIPITVEEIKPDAFSDVNDNFKIYGRTDSYAYEFYKEYKDKDWPFYNTPEFVPYYSEDLFVSLYTESYAVKSNIYCYGYASEGARIYIYDGDHLIGNNEQFKGNQYSKWEANVPLYKPVDSGSDHVITAVVVDAQGNRISSVPITVHYEKKAVVFQEFQMVHSYDYKLNVTTANVNRIHTLTWIPWSDNNDTYRVKFLNSNRLVELYMVSTTVNGAVSRIKLERAGEDTWIGNGSFGHYTPGIISFEGLFKKDFELKPVGPSIKITYLIDPSGNVYDFSTDNPLNGVTATVYYKDAEGSITQWDAEYYNQLNPIITGNDGFFKWDVHEGKWQIKFEKDGYEPLATDWMDVPPEVTGLQCFMKSSADLQVVESFYKYGITTIYFNKYVSVDDITEATFTSAEGVTLSDIIAVDEIYGVFDAAVYGKDESYSTYAGTNCITLKSDSYPGEITTTLGELSITPMMLSEDYSFLLTASQDDVYIGDELILTLTESNGATIPENLFVNVSVSNENIFDSEIPSVIEFDDEGNAVLSLAAGMPGEADVTFEIAGKMVVYNVEIKAVDETHVCEYDDYTVIPATCTKYGCEYRTCIECGNVEYSFGNKLKEHKFEENVADSAIKTIATCRGAAVYYKSCTVCGLTNDETFAYGNALSHIEDEAVKENETETSYDLVIRCQRCTYEFSRETVIVTPPECQHTDCTTITYAAPTCTENGRTEGKICNECGETLFASTVIPSEGHKEEVLPAKDATCEKTGLAEGKICTVCGVTTVAQKTVKAKGHKTEIVNKKPATAEEEGYTGDTVCTRCNKTLTGGQRIPALSEGCKCNCHKTGISAVFWKILLFFYKIFRTKAVCECSAVHY